MHCQKFMGFLIATDQDKILVTRNRCGMWDCPYCAQVNRKKWRARLLDAVNTLGERWYTACITARSSDHRNHTTLPAIQDGWSRLSRRMRYRAGSRLAYCRVYERHKSGEYHSHIICNHYFGTRFFKDDAFQCGLGYMGTHKECKTDYGAVRYATKYMTKLKDPLPRGTRRVQCSQNFPAWRKDSELNWTYFDDLRERDYDLWCAHNLDVVDLADDHIITYDDFKLGWYERTDKHVV